MGMNFKMPDQSAHPVEILSAGSLQVVACSRGEVPSSIVYPDLQPGWAAVQA